MSAVTTTSPITVTTPSPWSVQREDSVVFITRRGCGTPRPEDWRTRMVDALASMPVVAVGARRLDPSGTIFSMGEFVMHPKGFHHLGLGIEAEAYRFPEEVDTHAGGVIAVRADAFDEIDGHDFMESARGELGLLELGLALRRRGGRIITLPEVSVTDAQILRPGVSQRAAFAERWGFDVLAADLDDVRSRHGGTGLFWNTRLHGRPLAFEKYDRRGAMHWTAYRDVDAYRQRADHLVSIALRLTPGGTALDLGCGDGLFVHLLASAGLDVLGVDPEPAALREATAAVAGRSYPIAAPRFEAGLGERLPCDDDTLATVAMLDVIEHLPNPVAVLRECRRVLRPGGHLLITTPAWQYGGWSDPVYHVTEYTAAELQDQVVAATGMTIATVGRIGGMYRDVVLVARKS